MADAKDIALEVCEVTIDLVLAVHSDVGDPVRIQALAAKEAIRMTEVGPSKESLELAEKFFREYDSAQMMVDGEVREHWKVGIAKLLDEARSEAMCAGDKAGYTRGKMWGRAAERNRVVKILEGPCGDVDHNPEWCGRCEQRKLDVEEIRATKPTEATNYE